MDFGRGAVVSKEPHPFYLVPDLPSAEQKSRQHLLLFEDMQRIRRTTPEGARILWFSPAYLNLLAERRGVPFPNTRDAAEFRRQIYRTGAPLLFVSQLIPHRTSDDGRRRLAAVVDFTKPLWIDYGGGGEWFSMLLRIDHEKLARLVGEPLSATDDHTDAGLYLPR
jgi:hypothetical protein